jgi:cobaltochelatase CobT subunit
VAVIRGWADSLALTAACHDAKLHARLAPKSGPARAVFEAVERARVEALGSNRMPGMAMNLTARVEDQYGHGRYAEITERADAPLEDALSLIVRERLTGAAPPESAKAMVDLWRSWVDERAGRTLAKLDKLPEDQEAFGRMLRDLLKVLDLSEELSEGDREEGEDDEQDPESGDQSSEDTSEGQDRRMRTPTSSTPTAKARRWRRRASRGAPTRASSITPRRSATRSSTARTTRRSPPISSPRPTSWSACAASSTRSCATCRAPWRASPTACSAS